MNEDVVKVFLEVCSFREEFSMCCPTCGKAFTSRTNYVHIHVGEQTFFLGTEDGGALSCCGNSTLSIALFSNDEEAMDVATAYRAFIRAAQSLGVPLPNVVPLVSLSGQATSSTRH